MKTSDSAKIYIFSGVFILFISIFAFFVYQRISPEKEEIALDIPTNEDLQAFAQQPQGFLTENDINTSILEEENNNILAGEKEEPGVVEEETQEEQPENVENNEEENTAENANENQSEVKKAEFVPFENEIFEKAKSENKTILLYFYANWCPTCSAEVPVVEEALSKLDGEKIIGLRVNYADDEVDDIERGLAEEHGVVYQHTKVIIKNGEVVEKSGYPWPDVKTYIDALKEA